MGNIIKSVVKFIRKLFGADSGLSSEFIELATILGCSVKDAVFKINSNPDLDNDGKREWVLKEMVDYCIQQNLPYKKRWINLLIEIAVVAIKDAADKDGDV